MKKTIFVFSILAVALFALSAASPALAAESQRGGPGNGGGNGNQGDLGTGTGVPVEQNIALDGLLEDLIHENLAIALGISPAELAARLDAGETISQIGLSLDFDLTTISEIVTQARADALVQAVATGLITQQQRHLERRISDFVTQRSRFFVPALLRKTVLRWIPVSTFKYRPT